MPNRDILRTLSAKCRDCYRCVRVCPVKAIGIKDNQAYIDQSRCILCGTCVRECPQQAKIYRNDVDKVIAMLGLGNVVASVAPSFCAVYGGAKAKRIPSALRKLGFDYVSETSEGAIFITEETKKIITSNKFSANICSACPVVVNYVEKYKPEYLSNLVPVMSPMIAHGKLLRNRLPKSKIVFIGPCIAKKQEAERAEYKDIIDAVITFRELDDMLDREGIELDNCPESGFDNATLIGNAKYFALPGGLLKTAEINNNGISNEIIHTSGSANVMSIFDLSDTKWVPEIIEPLFCNEGCINGPGILTDKNIFQRRADLIDYANGKPDILSVVKPYPDLNLITNFRNDLKVCDDHITEQSINEVFNKTDKANPEMRLDCGACGYTSCREKAKAVIRGMAEIEMCLPYMRKLAERKTDTIIENSPNGIVILDEQLNIISTNSAFKRFFSCGNSIIGKKILYLLDAQEYEKVATKALSTSDTVVHCYGRKYNQLIYSLPLEKQYVGIYNDLSGIQLTEAKLNKMKSEAIVQAQELLNHQIEMAMTMAKFLGDSTAKGEELVERLMSIYER